MTSPLATEAAPFGRVLTAMVTPFTREGELDLDAVQKVASYLVDQGSDGLVISGGGDVDPALYGGDPEDSVLRGVNQDRDASERRALDTALERGMPVLAICRGFQLVNVALGGTLHADLARDVPGSAPHHESHEALARPLHTVDVQPGSLLATWIGSTGSIPVNSEHHQGIRDLAPSLTAVATTPDGLVEAAESAERKVVGVQWHPEVLWPHEPRSASLLRGFVSECDALRRAPVARPA